MEMKPVDTEDKSRKNQIYFKSEVVVKGENYGWVMWTWISTLSQKEIQKNTYSQSFDFMYRLILLKKVDNKWEVDNGFGWSHHIPSDFSGEKLIIAPPLERDKWFYERYDQKQEKMVPNFRSYKDDSYFSEKVWAGIGEVDEDAKSQSKDLLQSILVYNIDGHNYVNKEIWGRDEEFGKGNDPRGYHSASQFYEKDKGWKNYSSYKNIDDTLETWYKPFRDKRIKWMDFQSKCNAWSRIRNQSTMNSDLQDLCYIK